MDPVTILVVDDHTPFRRAVIAVARAAGDNTVEEATDASEAMARLAAHHEEPVLALVDVNLGAESGIDLARRIASECSRTTVVLVSTMDERDLPADTAHCGAVAFVAKSMFDPARLRDLLTTAAGV